MKNRKKLSIFELLKHPSSQQVSINLIPSTKNTLQNFEYTPIIHLLITENKCDLQY